ncbi:hypothetical protein LTR72_000211 [Exophiala xenobiotica]|nr:hypothetical protein LTR92_002923 [Exophiala xenobiotica]KAK5231031.1 hypothetical protein LTR72_000211 [Exophiala xenobiotica]KAK5299545.1 hypothetical protein LTR14_001759 [Exophiala xenobiotica]KAK5448457.1 hypothetical protein LTR18_001545 [Exophiala xenobiotica]KAK5499616.1 hypothetical protein LTR55_000439 [Exophiala xenobiotica]
MKYQKLRTGVIFTNITRMCTRLINPSVGELLKTAELSGTLLDYYHCDISKLESTVPVFERAVADARHPLRGLVNCAAIGWVGPSISFPIDEAKHIIDVNLIGTMICAQAAAALVKENTFSASFVLIASMSGYIVNKGTPNAAYAASKAGVHQLTRNLASEWGHAEDGPSIRVNSVSPGVIRTPMTSSVLSNGDLEKMWAQESMLKRLSDPEEYRGSVVFLLSDASSYVTGADLLVDGGCTSW